MPDRRYTAEQVDAAVAALSRPASASRTPRRSSRHAAPGLQRVLDEALDGGRLVRRRARGADRRASPRSTDPDERLAAVRTLVAEETRLGMLVGVAVGFELAHELLDRERRRGEPT